LVAAEEDRLPLLLEALDQVADLDVRDRVEAGASVI